MNKLQEIEEITIEIYDAIIFATDSDIVGKMALHHEVSFILNKLLRIKELCGKE